MLATSSAPDATVPTGRVFDISRGCVDDGPGLRTVVFLKGCRLDCAWCHNPEGKTSATQIALHQRNCIGCGRCQDVCERAWTGGDWRVGCRACGRCAAACPTGARRQVGRSMEVTELVAELMTDADFYIGTGGGVTFSGGEPLAQPSFVLATADALRKQGILTAIETAGFWPSTLVSDVSARIDLVIFDLKHVRSERFKPALGADYRLALRNLKSLADASAPLELRITLVPDFNESVADLRAIATWLRKQAPKVPVIVQPFHRLGVAKERILGPAYAYARFPPTPRERVNEAVELMRAAGLDAEAA